MDGQYQVSMSVKRRVLRWTDVVKDRKIFLVGRFSQSLSNTIMKSSIRSYIRLTKHPSFRMEYVLSIVFFVRMTYKQNMWLKLQHSLKETISWQ